MIDFFLNQLRNKLNDVDASFGGINLSLFCREQRGHSELGGLCVQTYHHPDVFDLFFAISWMIDELLQSSLTQSQEPDRAHSRSHRRKESLFRHSLHYLEEFGKREWTHIVNALHLKHGEFTKKLNRSPSLDPQDYGASSYKQWQKKFRFPPSESESSDDSDSSLDMSDSELDDESYALETDESDDEFAEKPLQQRGPYKLHTPATSDASLQAESRSLKGLSPNRKHLTTLVATRGPKAHLFKEEMPIAIRIGMQLMWHSNGSSRSHKIRLLESQRVGRRLEALTIREGKKYDQARGAQKQIREFIKTYRIDLDELKEPNPLAYYTMNEFFHRRLRQDARPQAYPEDPCVISSAADCRITVWDSVELAHKFWVKGEKFNLPNLLHDDLLASELEGGSLAIFRLAPADYHRFHSPVEGIFRSSTRIPGRYYTVNPAAVNTKLNVFTRNRRTVCTIELPLLGGQKMAFVEIGAMLVGSITNTVSKNQSIKRGDEVGYFSYGGSTIIAVFPPHSVEWSSDLLENSVHGVETLVKVGEKIGHFKDTTSQQQFFNK